MSKIKKWLSQIGAVQKVWFWSKYCIKRGIYFLAYIMISILPERKNKMQEYPNTIQMPITYKCNFDCVMCGMRHLIKREDFTYEDLNIILQDKLFHKIRSVGLNGGEPFIKEDLVQCVEVILKNLPELKKISIISNGFFTEKMCEKLAQIKAMCKERKVSVSLSLSVDGIGEMQNFHRGNKWAWEKLQATASELLSNKQRYCDYLDIICTITKYNIYHINEVECWAEGLNIPVAYNIATENVRIDNHEKLEDFTIFNDEKARMMAQEFFYCKFKQTHSQKYFAIYYFIRNRKRIAVCPCKNNEWVTLTPNCQLGYCATHSKELGNAKEVSAYQLFHGNLPYHKELTTEHCSTCSHYSYGLDKDGKKKYIKELLRIHKSV